MGVQAVAKDILQLVGGEENVRSLVHCATRLRFTLNDRSKADKDKIEALDDVVTVVESGGQFQVVIGNHVSEVYQEIGRMSNLLNDDQAERSAQKGNLFGRLVDIVSSIFTPLLGVMAGAGILKGLLMICTNAGWLKQRKPLIRYCMPLRTACFTFFRSCWPLPLPGNLARIYLFLSQLRVRLSIQRSLS